MNKKETKRFEILYDRHLKKLKLQGKSEATISAYSREVRRLTEHFDCCPDKLTIEQLEDYFTRLVENCSGSTVKLDRLGLMFFWKHVLEQDWQWLNIVKPPSVKTIPDILTPDEVALIIHATRKVRYRVFLFTTYFMGLHQGENFLHLFLKHVLPKGFRRVRDFGYLQGNAGKIRILIQLILHVFNWMQLKKRRRPELSCPICMTPMRVIRFRFGYGRSG